MAIKHFAGKYEFLSNFSRIVQIQYEGDLYPTVEHAFQAAKTLDKTQRVAFQNPVLTPGESKSLGRSITLRPDWEQVKNRVMRAILDDKFSAVHPHVRQMLLDTGDELLIEGNHWHDQVWGDCYCGREVCMPEGQNRLGNTLMVVRDIIRCQP